MLLLVFNDPHFDAYGPATRTDSYLEASFNKLEEIKSIVSKTGVSHVLCTGDIFDKKMWNRVPTKLIARLSDALKAFPVPIKTLAGNHDEVGYDFNSVWEQPLGLLSRASGLEIIDNNKEYDLGEGVFLTGRSYHAGQDTTLDDYTVKRPEKAKFHIHLSHGTLIPKTPPFAPFTLYSQLEGKLNMDVLANGHLHSDYGIVQQGKTKICNVGSLMRGALTEDNIKREVGVLLVDTDKNTCKKINLKSAVSADKIFDIRKKETMESAEREITKLGVLIKHESGSIELSGPEGIRQVVRELKTIKEPVKSKIYALLDKAEQSL